jgi:hypothetical protein
MKDISQATALVIDNSLFLPIAFCLAQKCKRVLYWTPWETGFSKLSKGILGDGYSEIERCDDIWKVKDQVDFLVAPDIQHSGIQLEWESQGKAVWGSRAADSIELDRHKFLKLLRQVGLDVPQQETVKGITGLRLFLEDKENKYIKISKWRGDMETHHWRNWKLDRYWLDSLAVKFGPASELIPFLVFDDIVTDLEIGGDTYNVDGQWPSLMLHGVEWKDKSYFAAVTERQDMPEQIQAVLDAFGKVLAPYRYRNEWSMEVRVQGDKAFFIDPTCRGGLPSTASQISLWKNFPEIIYAGAHGELVEPEPAARFSIEVIIKAKGEKDEWRVVDLPKALRPWAKLTACCSIDGLDCFPPDDTGDAIGWLVAIGDTPKETLETIKEYVALLPPGLTAEIDSVAKVIEEIESAEAEGIEFTNQPMPKPAAVL